MYNFGPEANCNGIDTEMFFTNDNKVYQNMSFLKRICGNCVVKDECLDYALHHAVVGWWGGTSEKTRRVMQQKLNISPESVLISEKWIAQMILEIAVGAFIALTVHDVVAELAEEINYRINAKRRASRAKQLLEALSLEPYVYSPAKPVRKKAAAKPKPRKKAVAKRK